MFHVQQYDVAHSTSAQELIADVNDMIKRGWQPFGGIVMTHHEGTYSNGAMFAQAMIKGVEQI